MLIILIENYKTLLVEVTRDDAKQEIVVTGKTVESPHEPHLLSAYKSCVGEGAKFCPECTLGLNIKHTDVLILSQYVTKEGLMLPQRITGLCRLQQKRIGSMVTMAQKAGLMINLTPSYSKKDPTKRYGHKKCNKYFDERTITSRRYAP